MSRWADWFAISPEEGTAFVEARMLGVEAVGSLLDPLLVRMDDLPIHVAMDTAWEPIHRCLTGDRTNDLRFTCGPMPLKLAVLGGRQIYRHGYRTASLIDADKVPRLARALAKIDEAWMRAKFFDLPERLLPQIDVELFEWMWDHFRELPPFFAQAAEGGNAVVCTVSH